MLGLGKNTCQEYIIDGAIMLILISMLFTYMNDIVYGISMAWIICIVHKSVCYGGLKYLMISPVHHLPLP